MEGVKIMEEPLQILFDELAEHGLNWDEMAQVAAGINHPMAILDLAEWLALHRPAAMDQIIAKGNQLIKKYQAQPIPTASS